MSIKINLEFKTHIDLDFFARGIPVRLTRLLTDVQLKSINGWSKEHKAIIDTGNPISVIPYSIWQNIDFLLFHMLSNDAPLATSKAK